MGNIEGGSRKGQQDEMDGSTDFMDLNLSKLQELVTDKKA